MWILTMVLLFGGQDYEVKFLQANTKQECLRYANVAIEHSENLRLQGQDVDILAVGCTRVRED